MRPTEKIRIVNPIQQGSCWTGRNRAERYVRIGRAVFVGPNSIRFIDSDLRNASALKRAASAADKYDRVARTGVASLSAIKNLPVVGKPLVLLTDTRRSSPRAPHGRNGAVRIVVSSGEHVA